MNKHRITSILVLIISISLVGCGGGGGGDTTGKTAGNTPTTSQASALYTSRDIVKLAVNTSTTIDVRAADADGNIYPTQFNVTSAAAGACVTYPGTTSGEITLNAVPSAAAGCSDELTITGQNLTKKVTVKTYDPQVMDIGQGLLIKYVDDYTPADVDTLNGAKNVLTIGNGSPTAKITLWNPTEAGTNGWYAVGSMARFASDPNATSNFTADPNTAKSVYAVPMILVKDTSTNQDLLADPTSYSPAIYDHSWTTGIWPSTTDHESRFAFWNPECPDGYGALGSVTLGGNTTTPPPIPGAFKCVKNDYLVQGTFPATSNPPAGSLQWTYSAYGFEWLQVTIPDPTQISSDGSWIPLSPDTFVICNITEDVTNPLRSCGVNPLSKSKYSMLKIPTPVIESADTNGLKPQLKDVNTYYVDQVPAPPPVYLSSIRLPFTTTRSLNPVNADPSTISTTYKAIDAQVRNSPFIFVQRKTTYVDADASLNANNTTASPSKTGSSEVTYTYEQSKSEEFSKETSWSVSATATVSYTPGADLGGLGGSASVTATYGETYGWSQTTSSTFTSATTTTYGPYDVPPHTIWETLYQASEFDVLNEDGTNVVQPLPLGRSPLLNLSYTK